MGTESKQVPSAIVSLLNMEADRTLWHSGPLQYRDWSEEAVEMCSAIFTICIGIADNMWV